MSARIPILRSTRMMIHSFTLRIKCYNLIFSLTAYKIHSIRIYYIRPLDFICHFFYGFGIWVGFFNCF